MLQRCCGRNENTLESDLNIVITVRKDIDDPEIIHGAILNLKIAP